MRAIVAIIVFLFLFTSAYPGDTIYAREVLRQITIKNFLG